MSAMRDYVIRLLDVSSQNRVVMTARAKANGTFFPEIAVEMTDLTRPEGSRNRTVGLICEE